MSSMRRNICFDHSLMIIIRLTTDFLSRILTFFFKSKFLKTLKVFFKKHEREDKQILQYRVLSRTGLKIRKLASVNSDEVGRLACGSIFEVDRRTEVALPSLGTGSSCPRYLMRLHVVSPLEGWVTEEANFVCILSGQQIPKDCRAASEQEFYRRNKAALNSKGQDLRKVLGSECQDFVAVKDGYDIQRLKEDLKIAEEGHGFLAKKPVPGYTSSTLYENTHGWASIPLVSLDGKEGEEGNRHRDVDLDTGTRYRPTRALKKCSYFKEILTELEQEGLGKIQKVRLMKLNAGGYIAPHKDFFPMDSIVRLHIPIITNEKVNFRIRQSEKFLSPGVLWFTNVRQQHEVSNLSATDRIHLVLDLISSENFQDMLLSQKSQSVAYS